MELVAALVFHEKLFGVVVIVEDGDFGAVPAVSADLRTGHRSLFGKRLGGCVIRGFAFGHAGPHAVEPNGFIFFLDVVIYNPLTWKLTFCYIKKDYKNKAHGSSG